MCTFSSRICLMTSTIAHVRSFIVSVRSYISRLPCFVAGAPPGMPREIGFGIVFRRKHLAFDRNQNTV
jgi:hypothetical protein